MIERKSPKFRPHKVHTVFLEGSNPSEPIVGRHYTLTHSDRTGDLYLSIGLIYNEVQIERPYIRFMRDEVRAVWVSGSAKDADSTSGTTSEESSAHSNVYTNGSSESDSTTTVPPFVTHVYVHVSGGRVYGRAKQRNQSFQKDLPRALRAIRHGDAYLFTAHPELDNAPIVVHFQSDVEKYQRVEEWGSWKDYTIPFLRNR
ncbi:staygreen family protein [Alicyclobacillus fastidiosus]|uniref:Staygreen family protein n=1 Tax=Alicyclobacillus fastidiosus TaxID=392011 RepID=A0ABV5ADA0_9BACL|nr:staygreen family protein [Alicyclobacillus fastidiosus]WEH08737.1 staygreen family protein [Alicyclobacillus fastidiosus]